MRRQDAESPREEDRPRRDTKGHEWGEDEDGEWRIEDGGWKMEDGRWRMEDGRWRMEDGGWRMEGIGVF